MSDNEYDFGDILAEAEKGGGGGTSTTERLEGTFRLIAKWSSAANDEGELRKTKKGFPQISIVWQVVGGPDNEKETWHNIVFSPKSKGMAGKMLLDLGFTSDHLRSLSGPGNFKAGIIDTADRLLGVEVKMKISPQSNNRDFDTFEVLEVLNGPHIDSAPAQAQAAPSVAGLATGAIGLSSASYGQAIGVPAPSAPLPVGGGFIPKV